MYKNYALALNLVCTLPILIKKLNFLKVHTDLKANSTSSFYFQTVDLKSEKKVQFNSQSLRKINVFSSNGRINSVLSERFLLLSNAIKRNRGKSCPCIPPRSFNVTPPS